MTAAMLLAGLPDGMLALGAGTVLALGAAAAVLGPLVNDEIVEPPRAPEPRRSAPDPSSAIDALREIEFDRETGKLSDADYAALKASYTQTALAELRARDAGRAEGPDVADDLVERTIAGYRRAKGAAAAGPTVCPVDGMRPEPDALFCSACGRYLGDRCAHCGAPVTHGDARYCTGCGHTLGARAA